MKAKTVQLYNRNLEYNLRKSKRAKRLRLTVYYDGNLVVTLPKGFPEYKVEEYILEKSKWIQEKIDFFNKTFSKKLRLSKNNYLEQKDNVFELVIKRLSHFNKSYLYKYNKVIIKNQKTRWGSCSKNKNLNFNFRIGFLSKEMQDYVIVHELCHLKEMNHSRKFWNLIAKSLPNYLVLKKDIKNMGFKLF